MKINLFLLAFLSAAVMANRTHAEGPLPLVSYEGYLPQAEFQASSKHISFSLYDTPEAQVPLWGPQHFDNVAVVDGRYHVLLGTTDSAGRTLPDLSTPTARYLGISIEGRELLPRQRLLSALSGVPGLTDANAAAAPTREQAGTRVPGTPAGTIVAYWGAKPPDGWLPCDGSAIPEEAAYDRLRALTGPHLPDLRGLFLRGLGRNAEAAYRFEGDALRSLGQLQLDDFKGHAHPFEDYTFSENSGVPGNAWGHSGKSDIDNAPGSPYKHASAAVGGEETRPKNAGVYWIIKY